MSQASLIAADFPVIDFRRQSMVLRWQPANATWTGCVEPPSVVHGVALIRATPPYLCLYGHDQRLYLQIGTERHEFDEISPRITLRRGLLTAGLRRRFAVEAGGGIAFKHVYWNAQGDDFFAWIAARAADPAWRARAAREWSLGLKPAVLRAS